MCSISRILYLISCSSLIVPFLSREFWKSSFVSRQVDIPPDLRVNVFQAQFHTCFLQEYDTGIVGSGLMKGLSVASFVSWSARSLPAVPTWALVHFIFTFVWVDKVCRASMHRCTEELLTRDRLNGGSAVREEDCFLGHVRFRVLGQSLCCQSDCQHFCLKNGGVASK